MEEGERTACRKENEWRRNITKVSIEKNRFCGYTGLASCLWYNADTARLIELEDEERDIFMAGGFVGEDKRW